MRQDEKEKKKRKGIYLRNTKVSPATNLLDVTKTLHPVVSKCLRG
jgi:hypothetical protein